jgi:GAF domain-containing protein
MKTRNRWIEEIADDARSYLQLQRAGVELAQPVQRIRALRIDGRHEILVTREHHHDDKAADEHDVDHREHGEYQVRFLHRQQVTEDVQASWKNFTPRAISARESPRKIGASIQREANSSLSVVLSSLDPTCTPKV